MPNKRKRNVNPTPSKSRSEDDQVTVPTASSRQRPRHGVRLKKRDEGVSRSLARMLARAKGVKLPSGLDEGERTGKRSKKAKPSSESSTATDKANTAEAPKEEIPKILPGERLADYSARVDAALPFQGKLKRGKGPVIPGLKQPRTKTERKMQRMQSEWRIEDAKIKAKREEEADDLEDEMDEQLPGVSARAFNSGKKNAIDDPWAVVAKARAAKEKSTGLIGIHDVVQAPPKLKAQRKTLREAQAG